MITDTIGDFLTRIRNAQMRERSYITVPLSKMLVRIAEILKEEGFVKDFSQETGGKGGQKELKVNLRYIKRKPAISGLERVSRPGVRIYIGYRDIDKVLGGLGISILTTPGGVMTGENARKNKVGGEYLCRVW